MLSCAAILAAGAAAGAEHTFNFDEYPFEKTPAGFRSTVAGQGEPGEWKVILDDAPPAASPPGTNAVPTVRRLVLAQLSRNGADNHFPMLIYDGQTYGDFKLTTRFKLAGGAMAQMAGLVFRFQDEKNFYVLDASGLDNRIWFFKVVNGARGPLIGPHVELKKGTWYTMTIECNGNHIRCRFDGKEIMPMLGDNSFSSGKIGFWTKSDSVSYFADTRITYTRRETLAQTLVREALEEYPRLKGLRIYAANQKDGEPAVVASNDDKEIGEAGGKTEEDVIAHGRVYVGKAKGTATVYVPLRDRNGDPVAAVCVVLKSFPGQTEDNAAARARPIVRKMQDRVQSLEDLLR